MHGACLQAPPKSILNLIAYIYAFFLASALFGTSYVGSFYIALSPAYFFVENFNRLFSHPLGSYNIYEAAYSLIVALLFIGVLCIKIFKQGRAE